MEKLYSIQEVADYFKVSKQTVHNWKQKKLINTTSTPGGELRVVESELRKITERSK